MNRNKSIQLIFLLFSIFTLIQCKSDSLTTPKPRSFPRVIYPVKKYVPFDTNFCQFTFEYPAYAQIIQDTSFFGEKPVDACWFNIYVPEFQSLIFCTYYPLGKKNKLLVCWTMRTSWQVYIIRRLTLLMKYPLTCRQGLWYDIFNRRDCIQRISFCNGQHETFLQGHCISMPEPIKDSLAPLLNLWRKMFNTWYRL